MFLACALLAPLVCALWQAAHQGHWPLNGGVRHIGLARWGAVLTFAAMCAGVASVSSSLALTLTLTLPLATLSTAGMVYVPCARAWPRATLRVSVIAAGGGVLLATWVMVAS